MWPRFFNRGKTARPAGGVEDSSGFNVAAVFQPRKEFGTSDRPVENDASMWPRFFNRGKAQADSGSQAAYDASMWPRFFNRGKPATHQVVFNLLKLQCGRGFSTAESGQWRGRGRRGRRFNVAAVFQPRKGGLFHSRAAMSPSLQCGRGFSTAESRVFAATCPIPRSFNVAAVFQPRKAPVDGCRVLNERRFNVAAVFQPRKVSGGIRDVGTPWLQCGRGFSTAESIRQGESRKSKLRLQCGRGFSTAERPAGVVGMADSREASMWPRFFNRGKLKVLAV